MEYPYWLIVVGAALLMLGLAGLALRREAAAPADIANHQDSFELEDDLDQVEVYNRAAKEKRKARWTESHSEVESIGDRQNSVASS
jgi:hypothetical protein